MKIFNLQYGEGRTIFHLDGDFSNYTISYNYGKIKFENSFRVYNLPSSIETSDIIKFPRADDSHKKELFNIQTIKTMYRKADIENFNVSDIIDADTNQTIITGESIVTNINDFITVNAPTNVKIYVNDIIVPTGTVVIDGDRIKFEITTPTEQGITEILELAIGNTKKKINVMTKDIRPPAGVSIVGLDTTKFSYSHSGSYAFVGWRTPNINNYIHDGVDNYMRYYGDNKSVIYTPFDDSQIKITHLTNSSWGSLNYDKMFFNGVSFKSLGVTIVNNILTLKKGYNVLSSGGTMNVLMMIRVK